MDSSSNQRRGFYVAPYAIDGEVEGVGFWSIEKLSGKWLEECRIVLDENGGSFDVHWSGNLSHVETKFTAGSGAALATFRVNGKPAASIALASGIDASGEAEVLKMFIDSLSRNQWVQAAARMSAPFREILTFKQRPLMIVVPLPDMTIKEQDHTCVQQLAIHLAGAFLLKQN